MSASSVSNLGDEGQSLPGSRGPGSDVEKREPQQPSPTDQPTHPVEFAPPVQRCPNPACGKEIDYLYVATTENHSYSFELAEHGPVWEDEDNFAGATETIFECPECGYILTDTESEAVAFLANGTIPPAKKNTDIKPAEAAPCPA